MAIINAIKNALFQVDIRVLGLYRIIFGSVLFFDLWSRLSVIHLFYTNKSIFPTSYILSSPYKVLPFTLLPAFNQPWEVELFLYTGLLACLFFIAGYKTKLSQIIASIVVLSFHNKVTTLENGGDMVVNNFIIWSVFLPLGLSFSIDSIIKSLKEKVENNIIELNSYNKVNKKIYSIAYFACLLQIAMIYFFNYKTKTGDTWNNLTSLHYFFELDSFLTPLGYWAKDFFSQEFKSFLTWITLIIEMSVPFIIFIPIFTKYIRAICFTILIGFHLCIGLFMDIGSFSWIMIAVDILLLTSLNFNFIKFFLKKIHGAPITLIYDSDCGFCHYVVRIIKRLDLFNKVTIYGNEWVNTEYDDIRTRSILLFKNNDSNIIYSHHNAFFQLLNRLPFGFLFGWILIIPGINLIVNLCYRTIANNRANISSSLGLNTCGVPQQPLIQPKQKNIESNVLKWPKIIIINSIIIGLLIANIQKSLIVNEPYKSDYNFKETQLGRKVLRYLRMKQNWKMFAPSVLKSDVILVTDIETIKNKRIDPFTGKEPLNIDSVDFRKMNINYGQFVRKFMKRSVKNKTSSTLKQLEQWLKKPIIDINGNRYSKARSFKVWKLTQYSSKPGNGPKKIRKELVLEFPKEKQQEKKIPVNRKNRFKNKNRYNSKKKVSNKPEISE
ncbi:MAG: hypothetical protein CMF96_02225 [Candidatus Marinimicrobia bacterium]|nr:hypothetical protein [Candidatus Neomarinimicrobiota bacterium]